MSSPGTPRFGSDVTVDLLNRSGLARLFSWHAEDPIDDPDAVCAAVRRAAQIVIEEGRPAPVDVVCRHR